MVFKGKVIFIHDTESCIEADSLGFQLKVIVYQISMFMPLGTEALPHSMTKAVELYTVPSSSMVEPSDIDNHDDRLSASLESKGNAFRRRALSLAETQPSVETVIVKAKRAAQSLWMLLHAQVRQMTSSSSFSFPTRKIN